MDYLKTLAVFVRVAERGSFAAVAEELGVSGTMVGKHVQALERRLGGRLVARTTRRQSLTDLGAEFCERARAILADVEAADGLAEEMRRLPRGTLRVSAPTALGVEVLVDAIADYRRAYPEVEVELSVTDRVVDLVDEGFHVAVRTGEGVDQGLVERKLRPYRVVACASPAYLAGYSEIREPEDLLRHSRLSFAHWGEHPVWRFRRGEETRAVPVVGAFRSDSVIALRRAALTGLGVAVLAEALIGEAIATGTLQRILPEWELRARPTVLAWPPYMRASAKLRSFVEFIGERLGEGVAVADISVRSRR